MKRSIALRLAAMFAIAAFCVFSLIGFALYRVVKQELDWHQLEQLNTKFQIMQYMIVRAKTTVQWDKVDTKLDALSPPDGSTQFWVWSDDAKFRYGKSLSQVGDMTHSVNGIGEMMLDQRPHAMKIQVEDIPASGERPAVRFMVGIDSAPYYRTRRAVGIALVVLSAGGIALATLLGYAIAQLGLKPLKKLSQEAHALSPKNLAQRLQLVLLPTELSNLGASFNGALDRLEAAYQQLEAFNADVTHELRTPLANLIGQTQVALSRERTAPQLVEVLQSNLEELERLRAIVNDMLFLTRADQGERAMKRVPASIAAEVNKTVEFLDFILDEADITVRVRGDAQGHIETSLFRRAMTNLLHNAIQHSQAKSEIVVDVSAHEAGVRIAVSNAGPEIPQEHLTRIFDRFYRIDSSRHNSWESHGLGLSIVKAIAIMHNGTVFASSGDGVTAVGFSVGAV